MSLVFVLFIFPSVSLSLLLSFFFLSHFLFLSFSVSFCLSPFLSDWPFLTLFLSLSVAFCPCLLLFCLFLFLSLFVTYFFCLILSLSVFVFFSLSDKGTESLNLRTQTSRAPGRSMSSCTRASTSSTTHPLSLLLYYRRTRSKISESDRLFQWFISPHEKICLGGSKNFLAQFRLVGCNS